MNPNVIIAHQIQQIQTLSERLHESERSDLFHAHKSNQLQQQVEELKAANNQLSAKVSDAVRALEWAEERISELEKNEADLRNSLENVNRENKLHSYINERIDLALYQPLQPEVIAQLRSLKQELFEFTKSMIDEATTNCCGGKSDLMSVANAFLVSCIEAKFKGAFGIVKKWISKKEHKVLKLQLYELCTSFLGEVIANRKDSRDYFEEVEMNSSFARNASRQFKSRISVSQEMLSLLFKAQSAPPVVAFLAANMKKEVLPKLNHNWGMKVSDTYFTAEKLLWLHFFLGSTYSALKLLSRAIIKVTSNNLTVDNMDKVRTYRDSLTVGKVKVFENPEGSTVGRVWPLMDMLPRVFESEDITKAHDFYFGRPNNSPAVIMSSHFDGHEETSFAHITNGVSRLAGLGDRSRNPATLLVHFIDEGSENSSLMYKYFREEVVPALRKFEAEGVPVTCFNVQQCQLCHNGHPRERMGNIDAFEELWKHGCVLSGVRL